MQHITKFSLLKRRSELSHEQFSDYWSNTHAKVLMEFGHQDYNATYTQNHFTQLEDKVAHSLLFDGAAQMEQRDGLPLGVGFQEDPRYMKHVRLDEQEFLDVENSLVVFTRRNSLRAGFGISKHKLMTFIKNEAEYRPMETFHAKAINDLGPHVIQLAKLDNTLAASWFAVLEGASRGLKAVDYDSTNQPTSHFIAVFELCFESNEKMRASVDHLQSALNDVLPGSDLLTLSVDAVRIY